MTFFLIYIHTFCLVTYQMFKPSLYLLQDTSIHALLSHTGAQAGSEHIYIRPTLLHFTMDPLKMLALTMLGFYWARARHTGSATHLFSSHWMVMTKLFIWCRDSTEMHISSQGRSVSVWCPLCWEQNEVWWFVQSRFGGCCTCDITAYTDRTSAKRN